MWHGHCGSGEGVGQRAGRRRSAGQRQAMSGHAHLAQGSEISVRLDGKRMYELDGGAKGKADALDFSVAAMAVTLCAGPG